MEMNIIDSYTRLQISAGLSTIAPTWEMETDELTIVVLDEYAAQVTDLNGNVRLYTLKEVRTAFDMQLFQVYDIDRSVLFPIVTDPIPTELTIGGKKAVRAIALAKWNLLTAAATANETIVDVYVYLDGYKYSVTGLAGDNMLDTTVAQIPK